MTRYEFELCLAADGNTPEEAWESVVENFMLDGALCPPECKIVVEEDER